MEQAGIKPQTFQLVDDLFCLLGKNTKIQYYNTSGTNPVNLLRQVTSVRECYTDLHVCLSSYHILNTPSLFSSLANIPSLPLMCQCFCCLAIIACCFNISITAAYTCSLWGMFSRHSPTSVVTIFIGSDDHQDWMPGYVFQC